MLLIDLVRSLKAKLGGFPDEVAIQPMPDSAAIMANWRSCIAMTPQSRRHSTGSVRPNLVVKPLKWDETSAD